MTHHAGQVQLPGQVSGAAFLGSLFTKKGALKKLRARVIAKAKGKSKAKPGTHRPKNQPSVSFFFNFYFGRGGRVDIFVIFYILVV